MPKIAEPGAAWLTRTPHRYKFSTAREETAAATGATALEFALLRAPQGVKKHKKASLLGGHN